MSYGVTGYLVDIDLLKSIVGSGDHQLLSSLIETLKEDINYFNQEFGSDYLPMEQTLSNIIHGNFEGEGLYGYGLQLICGYIGKVRYPRHLFGLSFRWLYTQDELKKLRGSVGELWNDLPKNLFMSEFPSIGYFAKDSLQENISLAVQAKNKINDDSTIECYSEYIEWLELANDNKLSLITFLH